MSIDQSVTTDTENFINYRPKSLALVSRIMRDILRNERKISLIEFADERANKRESEILQDQYESSMEERGSLDEELSHVGVNLYDSSSDFYIEFPFIHPRTQEEIYLVWQVNKKIDLNPITEIDNYRLSGWYPRDDKQKNKRELKLLNPRKD